MKKEYICPEAMMLETVADEGLLADSGVQSNDEYGIEYGGTDDDGGLEPAVRAVVHTFFVTGL